VLSSISSLRAIGPMGRWPEIDKNKKYPDNPVYPVRFKINKLSPMQLCNMILFKLWESGIQLGQ
jgi:hypothetical protein